MHLISVLPTNSISTLLMPSIRPLIFLLEMKQDLSVSNFSSRVKGQQFPAQLVSIFSHLPRHLKIHCNRNHAGLVQRLFIEVSTNSCTVDGICLLFFFSLMAYNSSLIKESYVHLNTQNILHTRFFWKFCPSLKDIFIFNLSLPLGWEQSLQIPVFHATLKASIMFAVLQPYGNSPDMTHFLPKPPKTIKRTAARDKLSSTPT